MANKRSIYEVKLQYMYDIAKEQMFNIDFLSFYQRVKAAAFSQPNILKDKFILDCVPDLVNLELPDVATETIQIRDKMFEAMSVNKQRPFNRDLFSKSLQMALRQFELQRHSIEVTPLSIAADDLPKTTNTGFPHVASPKRDYLQETLNVCHSLLANCEFGWIIASVLSIVFWRTQVRETGIKIRPISAMPFFFQIFENAFFFGLKRHFDKHRFTTYCYSNNHTELSKYWRQQQIQFKTVAVDYSQFDQSIGSDVITMAMRALKGVFILNDVFSTLWDTITICHVKSRISASYRGNAVCYVKKDGLISGSVFTNFLGSLINQAMLNYGLMYLGYDPADFCFKIKSDDTLMSHSTNLDEYKLFSILTQHFGTIMKPDSQETYKPGERWFFLGYYFDDKSKLSSSELLLHKKIYISSRYIDPAVLPEATRVISKIVSVLSNVSNGYSIFNRVYRKKYLAKYNLSELPKYYHDLSERDRKSVV